VPATPTPVAAASVVPTAAPAAAAPADAAPAVPVYAFPEAKYKAEYAHLIPTMPIPAGVSFDESLIGKGDAERGRQVYSRSSCIGCHAIKGNMMSAGVVGPNLTHVGTRFTIAGGLYPNDAKHLAYWIKNAPHMKPGSIMPSIGTGEYDPVRKNTVKVGGLSDAEIADIVAYLQALK
jgi:cytochrome c oxidase subunit 2